MPMSNTTYVAPTWRNAQGPAIDATELQAMCNTIAGNQAQNLSQDTSISTLQIAVTALQTGGAKVEVGSYVGTGTYGANNPTTITCSFAPKVVIVAPKDTQYSIIHWPRVIWVYDATVGTNGNYSDYSSQEKQCIIYFSRNNNVLSFWGLAEDARYQLNAVSTRYVWVTVG